MKKIIVILSLLVIGIVLNTKAQTTPGVDAREQNQRARIQSGVASGEVTRSEAARLRHEQRHIRRTERRAKADGTVTPRERRRLQHEQSRASRDIRRQKHDRQERPAAN